MVCRHRETAHIRVLMRQEKTMKVISNHVLDPRIIITPNASSPDRSWVWTAFDFAEGELVETVRTAYILRIRTEFYLYSLYNLF